MGFKKIVLELDEFEQEMLIEALREERSRLEHQISQLRNRNGSEIAISRIQQEWNTVDRLFEKITNQIPEYWRVKV